MYIENFGTVNIYLSDEDCGQGNVVVVCKYSPESAYDEYGNYYVEYTVGLLDDEDDCFLGSETVAAWIMSTEECIARDVVKWFKRNMLKYIGPLIDLCEEELEDMIEEYLEDIDLDEDDELETINCECGLCVNINQGVLPVIYGSTGFSCNAYFSVSEQWF